MQSRKILGIDYLFTLLIVFEKLMSAFAIICIRMLPVTGMRLHIFMMRKLRGYIYITAERQYHAQ